MDELEEHGARVRSRISSRRSGAAASATPSGLARRGSTAAAPARTSRVTSRTQRKPKTATIAAPTATTPAHDEPDEHARDADREADRPEARRGRCGFSSWCSLTLGSPRDSTDPVLRACQRRTSCRNAAPTRAILPICVGRRAPGCRTRPSGASTSSRTSGLISISGGHSRAPSAGPFAVASMPSLPPYGLQRRRVVELVERPLGEHDVALRVDVGARRRRRPARSRARPRARRPRRPTSRG